VIGTSPKIETKTDENALKIMGKLRLNPEVRKTLVEFFSHFSHVKRGAFVLKKSLKIQNTT